MRIELTGSFLTICEILRIRYDIHCQEFQDDIRENIAYRMVNVTVSQQQSLTTKIFCVDENRNSKSVFTDCKEMYLIKNNDIKNHNKCKPSHAECNLIMRP